MSRFQFEFAGPEDDADTCPGHRGNADARSYEGQLSPRAVLVRRRGRRRPVLPGHRLPGPDDGPDLRLRFALGPAAHERPAGAGWLPRRPAHPAGVPQPWTAGRGYAFFRQAHTDGRCRFYLTTVATGNKPAQEVLTSGRAGLPSYLPAGDYCTLALPRLRRIASTGLEVRPAADADLPRVLAFLAENGPRRQFFPCYAAEDFQEPGGSLRGLGASNILLAERSGRVVGTLAGWDQHGFRQSVIEGYGGWLRWARPWYNLLSRLHGRPQLPALGHSFHYLTAALPVIRDDSPHTFGPAAARALLDGGKLVPRAAGASRNRPAAAHRPTPGGRLLHHAPLPGRLGRHGRDTLVPGRAAIVSGVGRPLTERRPINL